MAKKDVKKTSKPTKKNTVKVDTEKESLTKELRGLIPKLDSEGLAFLLEQARVHIYNMQVDELNRAAIAANEAAAKTASARAAKGKSAAGKSKSVGKPIGGRDGYSIAGTESGSSFYLLCPSDELMFSRSEMAHLVKIVNAKGTDLEIRERLYAWFERERRDAFSVIPIADKFDNRLKIVAGLLKKSFKLQDS